MARNMVDSKASVRGMQVALRDIRLASSAEDIKKATDYLAARRNSAVRFIDDSLKLADRPEVKEKIALQRPRIEEYATVIGQAATRCAWPETRPRALRTSRNRHP